MRARNPKVKIVIAYPALSKVIEDAPALVKSMTTSTQSPLVLANIGTASDTEDPDAEQARKIATILADALSALMPTKKTSIAQ